MSQVSTPHVSGISTSNARKPHCPMVKMHRWRTISVDFAAFSAERRRIHRSAENADQDRVKRRLFLRFWPKVDQFTRARLVP